MVAGTRSGGNFARCFLRDTVRNVIARCDPTTSTQAWVDDIVQRAEGSRKRVIHALVKAGKFLVEGLKRLDLKVASKSAIISTCPEVGRSIVAALSNEGISIEYVDAMADLGVDRGCKTRSGRPKAHARFEAAVRRYEKCKKLASLGSMARNTAIKLAATGAAPQEQWADAIHGAAPTVVEKRRRTWGCLLSKSKQGRCLTTLLQLELGCRDPAIATAMSVVDSWIYIVQQRDQHKIVTAFWSHAVERISAIPSSARWKHVKACGTAIITLLLDMKWVLHGPVDWTSDDGIRYAADLQSLGNKIEDWSALKEGVVASVKRRMWD